MEWQRIDYSFDLGARDGAPSFLADRSNKRAGRSTPARIPIRDLKAGSFPQHSAAAADFVTLR